MCPKKRCERCLGTGRLSAIWSIGETGVVPLVPCPVCHGDGSVTRSMEAS